MKGEVLELMRCVELALNCVPLSKVMQPLLDSDKPYGKGSLSALRMRLLDSYVRACCNPVLNTLDSTKLAKDTAPKSTEKYRPKVDLTDGYSNRGISKALGYLKAPRPVFS